MLKFVWIYAYRHILCEIYKILILDILNYYPIITSKNSLKFFFKGRNCCKYFNRFLQSVKCFYLFFEKNIKITILKVKISLKFSQLMKHISFQQLIYNIKGFILFFFVTIDPDFLTLTCIILRIILKRILLIDAICPLLFFSS